MDRGEPDVVQRSERGVVEADHRDLVRDYQTGPLDHVDGPYGREVVGGEDRGRTVGTMEQALRAAGPGFLGEITSDHVSLVGQTEYAHRLQIAAAARRGAGTLSTVDVSDASMTELMQMLDRKARPIGIVGGHGSEDGLRQGSTDRHDGDFAADDVEPGRRQPTAGDDDAIDARSKEGVEHREIRDGRCAAHWPGSVDSRADRRRRGCRRSPRRTTDCEGRSTARRS